jgi:hypothetical protein
LLNILDGELQHAVVSDALRRLRSLGKARVTTLQELLPIGGGTAQSPRKLAPKADQKPQALPTKIGEHD